MAVISQRQTNKWTVYFIELPALNKWYDKERAVASAVNSIIDEAVGSIKLSFDISGDSDYLDIITDFDFNGNTLRYYRREGNKVKIIIL